MSENRSRVSGPEGLLNISEIAVIAPICADATVLFAPFAGPMRSSLSLCDKYANWNIIVFNANKSKHLLFRSKCIANCILTIDQSFGGSFIEFVFKLCLSTF